MLFLDPADGRPGKHARQKRIFAKIFEIAPIARIARQIDTTCEQDIEPLAPGFLPDHRAPVMGKGHVERGGERKAGGQCGRAIARADIERIGDAKTGIGFLQRRNAQPFDAGHVARRAERARRHRGAQERDRQFTVYQPDLLILRQRLHKQAGARVC